KGKPQPDPAFDPFLQKYRTGDHVPTAEEITDRMFLAMLLEATRVLEERIVREPADVDMGLILGIGFPPFKGGVLRWAHAEGPAKLVERLKKYAPLGKRSEPRESLEKLAREGGRFYPIPAAVAKLAKAGA